MSENPTFKHAVVTIRKLKKIPGSVEYFRALLKFKCKSPTFYSSIHGETATEVTENPSFKEVSVTIRKLKKIPGSVEYFTEMLKFKCKSPTFYSSINGETATEVTENPTFKDAVVTIRKLKKIPGSVEYFTELLKFKCKSPTF